MREEAMKINPIFGRIKHQLGNKFLQTGMTPKFGFDKRIQERDLINIQIDEDDQEIEVKPSPKIEIDDSEIITEDNLSVS